MGWGWADLKTVCLKTGRLRQRKTCHLGRGLPKSSLPSWRGGSLGQTGCEWALMSTGRVMVTLSLRCTDTCIRKALEVLCGPRALVHPIFLLLSQAQASQAPLEVPQGLPRSKKLRSLIHLNKSGLSLGYSFHLKSRKQCRSFWSAGRGCE